MTTRTEYVSRPLRDGEAALLVAVCDRLVTRSDGTCTASELPDIETWVQRAARARVADLETLQEILHGLETPVSDADLRWLADERPGDFELLATVAVGAYTMHPLVQRRVSYPGQHRNPPAIDEAANDLSSGIMDGMPDASPIREAPA